MRDAGATSWIISQSGPNTAAWGRLKMDATSIRSGNSAFFEIIIAVPISPEIGHSSSSHAIVGSFVEIVGLLTSTSVEWQRINQPNVLGAISETIVGLREAQVAWPKPSAGCFHG